MNALARCWRPTETSCWPAISRSRLKQRARLSGAGHDRAAGQLDDLASVLTAGPELAEASSRLSIEQLAELQRPEPAPQLVDVRTPADTARGTLKIPVKVPVFTGFAAARTSLRWAACPNSRPAPAPPAPPRRAGTAPADG